MTLLLLDRRTVFGCCCCVVYMAFRCKHSIEDLCEKPKLVPPLLAQSCPALLLLSLQCRFLIHGLASFEQYGTVVSRSFACGLRTHSLPLHALLISFLRAWTPQKCFSSWCRRFVLFLVFLSLRDLGYVTPLFVVLWEKIRCKPCPSSCRSGYEFSLYCTVLSTVLLRTAVPTSLIYWWD